MSTYLRFINFITFQTPTYTTNAAGQKIPTSFTEHTDIPCVFLYMTSKELSDPLFKDDVIEFVVGDEVEPTYNNTITNLKDRYGDIIEAGPLEIIGIRKYAGFQGFKHHYRIKARKLREC